jgi:undecaprenyl diphosphate synthase
LTIWKNKRKMIAIENIDMDRIPKHLAIIMDGNGRWAKQQGMPRTMGHRAGVEALRSIVKLSSNLGIKYLTVYAFSTENWRRPQSEIGILMSLLKEYVRKELDELHTNNVKIKTLGNIHQLPKDVLESVLLACQKTKNNTGLVFNLALNYGGRAELIRAVKKIINDVQNNCLGTEEINETLFDSYLYTAGCPEPELLIRTSGEMRLSNFLLWQVAYSELVVVKECWPDFNEESLCEAIRIYQNRERRFGGI